MRLIDADVIHGEIDIFNPEGRISLKNIKIYIDAQPTAYDVNKVMEELEEELTNAEEEKRRCILENAFQFDFAKGYAMGIYNATEIVKKGGSYE